MYNQHAVAFSIKPTQGSATIWNLALIPYGWDPKVSHSATCIERASYETSDRLQMAKFREATSST